MSFVKHAIIVLLLLVVIGCAFVWIVIDRGRIDITADGEPWPVTTWLLDTIREHAVARQAQGITARMPDLDDRDLLLESLAGYEDMCAVCHTPPGGSPTTLARGLKPPAPDLAEAALTRTAEELFWVTKHGIRMTGMPAWGPTHADEELWPIIALITRFPEFADEDYVKLLQAAREAGVEHVHDHGEDHDHHDDHHHDHRRNHDNEENDHEHEHPSHDDEDTDEHEHDHQR